MSPPQLNSSAAGRTVSSAARHQQPASSHLLAQSAPSLPQLHLLCPTQPRSSRTGCHCTICAGDRLTPPPQQQQRATSLGWALRVQKLESPSMAAVE
ncbi:unnamed protein product [Miscanthus lutarioriparius]|uniref:Uncharacterized protein n=1 Tax=Miscanthus lutarioriparius TaxID=422564 RepID=A0A811PJS2_9POAL|nr:unnamed protein product [Miscanthus lutarioriparius]